MTPEVEAILQRVGWDVVRRASPAMALQLARPFQTPFAGSLVSTDAESRKLAAQLRSLGEAAFFLFTGLEALPETVRRNVDIAALADPLLLSDVECPSVADDVRLVLARLFPGLEATEARLNFEGGNRRPGSPRNLAPHAIADAAAQIYVIGMGSLPVAYNETAGHVVRGLFGEVLEDLFDALGLGFDAIGPARSAIKRLASLSDEEWAGLMLVRCPVTRTSVQVGWRRQF